jgi:DNA topoisomerase-2
MLMTDQDYDGSHIKGLFINFIHKFWPELLEKHNFLEELVTPIVKATKGKTVLSFFTLKEYEAWRDSLDRTELARWTIKYYKGLGTSTSAEAKEYFSNLQRHKLEFEWNSCSPNEEHDIIDMVFNKNRAEDRKKW